MYTSKVFIVMQNGAWNIQASRLLFPNLLKNSSVEDEHDNLFSLIRTTTVADQLSVNTFADSRTSSQENFDNREVSCSLGN